MATWSCGQEGVSEGEKAEVTFYQIGGKKETTWSKTNDGAFTSSHDQDEAVINKITTKHSPNYPLLNSIYLMRGKNADFYIFKLLIKT